MSHEAHSAREGEPHPASGRPKKQRANQVVPVTAAIEGEPAHAPRMQQANALAGTPDPSDSTAAIASPPGPLSAHAPRHISIESFEFDAAHAGASMADTPGLVPPPLDARSSFGLTTRPSANLSVLGVSRPSLGGPSIQDVLSERDSLAPTLPTARSSRATSSSFLERSARRSLQSHSSASSGAPSGSLSSAGDAAFHPLPALLIDDAIPEAYERGSTSNDGRASDSPTDRDALALEHPFSAQRLGSLRRSRATHDDALLPMRLAHSDSNAGVWKDVQASQMTASSRARPSNRPTAAVASHRSAHSLVRSKTRALGSHWRSLQQRLSSIRRPGLAQGDRIIKPKKSQPPGTLPDLLGEENSFSMQEHARKRGRAGPSTAQALDLCATSGSCVVEGALVWRCRADGAVLACSSSADLRVTAFVTGDTVFVWEPAACPQPVFFCAEDDSRATLCRLTPDGGLLLVSGPQSAVHVYDLDPARTAAALMIGPVDDDGARGQPHDLLCLYVGALLIPDDEVICGLVMAADGAHVAVVTLWSTVYVFVVSPSMVETYGAAEGAATPVVVVLPPVTVPTRRSTFGGSNRQTWAIGRETMAQSVRGFRVSARSGWSQHKDSTEPIVAVAFVQREMMACLSEAGRLNFVRFADSCAVVCWCQPEDLETFATHHALLQVCTVSGSGPLVLCATAHDSSVYLWQLLDEAVKLHCVLCGHHADISQVAFSHCGHRCLTLDESGVVCAWVTGTGNQLFTSSVGAHVGLRNGVRMDSSIGLQPVSTPAASSRRDPPLHSAAFHAPPRRDPAPRKSEPDQTVGRMRTAVMAAGFSRQGSASRRPTASHSFREVSVLEAVGEARRRSSGGDASESSLRLSSPESSASSSQGARRCLSAQLAAERRPPAPSLSRSIARISPKTRRNTRPRKADTSIGKRTPSGCDTSARQAPAPAAPRKRAGKRGGGQRTAPVSESFERISRPYENSADAPGSAAVPADLTEMAPGWSSGEVEDHEATIPAVYPPPRLTSSPGYSAPSLPGAAHGAPAPGAPHATFLSDGCCCLWVGPDGACVVADSLSAAPVHLLTHARQACTHVLVACGADQGGERRDSCVVFGAAGLVELITWEHDSRKLTLDQPLHAAQAEHANAADARHVLLRPLNAQAQSDAARLLDAARPAVLAAYFSSQPKRILRHLQNLADPPTQATSRGGGHAESPAHKLAATALALVHGLDDGAPGATLLVVGLSNGTLSLHPLQVRESVFGHASPVHRAGGRRDADDDADGASKFRLSRCATAAGTGAAQSSVTHLSVSPDGRTLVAVHRSGTVAFWNISSAANGQIAPLAEAAVPPPPPQRGEGLRGGRGAKRWAVTGPLTCSKWAPDSSVVILSGCGGYMLWQAGPKPVLTASVHAVTSGARVGCCAMSGCGSAALFVTDDHRAVLLCTATGQTLRSIPAQAKSQTRSSAALSKSACALGPAGGCQMATTLPDKTIALWGHSPSNAAEEHAAPDGNPPAVLRAHHTPVIALSFSACGRLLASGDEAGYVMVWHVDSRHLLQATSHHRAPVAGLQFTGRADVLVSSSFRALVAASVATKPTVEEVMAMWLDGDRPPELNAAVTRQLLASYPTLPNAKDGYGVSLLAYAAGVGVVAVSGLLSTIMERAAPGCLGLVSCGKGHYVARKALRDNASSSRRVVYRSFKRPGTGVGEGVEDTADVDSSHASSTFSQTGEVTRLTAYKRLRSLASFVGLYGNDVHQSLARHVPRSSRLDVLTRLSQHRQAHHAREWDWEATCGVARGANLAWNVLELTLLADFPSNTEALLKAMIAEAPPFSAGSDCGVMATMDLLAAKHPRRAVRLLSSAAAMRQLATFYVTRVSERTLVPCMAITHRNKAPITVEGMWNASKALKPVVALSSQASTLRVDATVCPWPHVASFGAAGLLHIIVKHDMDINIFNTELVQAVIMHKWRSHARRTLVKEVALYFLLMILFILDLSIVGRAMYGSALGVLSYWGGGEGGATAEGWWDTSANGLGSTICEALIICIVLRNVALMFARLRSTTFSKLVRQGWNGPDLFSHAVLLTLVGVRLAGHHVTEHKFFISTAACVAMLLWSKMLFFMMPFQTTGPLVRMIMEISRDMVPFLIVLALVVVGFSGAFYILFIGSDNASYNSFENVLLSTFVMMLGSFDVDYFRTSEYRGMAVAMFCAYEVLCVIVLLNLLIAIMGDTFQRVKGVQQLHFWKGRAAVIDEIEMLNQSRAARHRPEHPHTPLAAHLHTLSLHDGRAEDKGSDRASREGAHALQRLQDYVSQELGKHEQSIALLTKLVDTKVSELAQAMAELQRLSKQGGQQASNASNTEQALAAQSSDDASHVGGRRDPGT